MAFIRSRKNVGYFGLMNDENIDLFIESADCGLIDSTANNTLTVNDDFPIKIDETSENSTTKNDSSIVNGFSSASISDCGRFITATDVKKNVYLWEKKNHWEPVSRRILTRKPYKVMFTRNGSEVIVADRGGDVFSFSVNQPSEKGKLILGHISIILDMAMSQNDRFIVTCDRDGKIRVSNYPNCYDIHVYCLGHNEFVWALQFIYAPEELLISSSGDGTLKLWQVDNGTEEYSHLIKDIPSTHNDPTKVVKIICYCCELNIAVIFYNDMLIFDVFQISATNTFDFIQTISLSCVPIDAYFSNENILFIMLSSIPYKVVLFGSESVEHIKFKEMTDQQNYLSILTAKLNQKLSSYKIILGIQFDMLSLYKQCLSFKCDEDYDEKKSKKNKVLV